MAVRLDPWQNIVNVGWSDPVGGGGSGAPPVRPGFRGGVCAKVADLSSVDVEWKWSILAGGGDEPFDGEMLIAHVAAGGGSTIDVPGGGGWSEIYQETSFREGLPIFTAGVFFKIKEPGDPDVFTFTQSSDTGMSGAAGVISGADQSLSAVPEAVQVTHTPVGQTADSTPMFIQSVNPLILAFIDTDNENFLSLNYPEPPDPVWFNRYYCKDGSFAHGMVLFRAHSSVFTGPGTLPATGFSGPHFGMTEIVGVVAFAGE